MAVELVAEVSKLHSFNGSGGRAAHLFDQRGVFFSSHKRRCPSFFMEYRIHLSDTTLLLSPSQNVNECHGIVSMCGYFVSNAVDERLAVKL